MFPSTLRAVGMHHVSLRRKLFVLAFAGSFALGLAAPRNAYAQVTLSAGTLPAAAQPGIQSVRVTGSGFPAGAISPSAITVSLAPATPGTGPNAQMAAAGFARVVGAIGNVTFTVPASLRVTSPTIYSVSITGVTQTSATFSSTNTATLTIDPPASVAVTPAAGQQGQTLTVTLQGSYTNFAQGVTTANFGPGIAVGGAAPNTFGPVAVTSSTSATAQLVLAANAAVGTNSAVVASGVEQPSTAFAITAATPRSIDLAITKSHTGNFTQGQSGTYTIGVANLGPGATSGTVTVTDNLPTGLAVVSMIGTGWTCSGTTCTRTDALAPASAYPAITLTASASTGAARSVINSVSVSGGGTDSNALNNTATDPTTVLQVPSTITTSGGTPQSAPINTAFGTPLQALVKDAGGSAISGVTVTFAAPASGAGGAFSSGATAITNANGIATASTFTANGTAGAYTVTVSAPGVSTSASFNLSNTVGTPTNIAASGGTPQSAAINAAFGSPLQVTVTDAGHNPVSGVTVTFNVPSSGAGATFANGNTAVTNASGIAISSTLTANATAGAYSVNATVSGVATPAIFSLNNTAGTPASIAATIGTPQSATVSTAFGSPLQVAVRDAGGNPLSGITVTFTAPVSGASGSFAPSSTAITNASGIATSGIFTANGAAGAYTVLASVSGVTTGASFSLTNTPGAPASIAVVSGTPQSAIIDAAFAARLGAVVKDAQGNPISGVTVSFAPPAAGPAATLTSTTAITDASGFAISSALTANATAGVYSVTATVAGVAIPATFSLTNLAGPAASITASAGTPQSAPINTVFGVALQATVRDTGNNPVSGVTVNFALPASGAGGSFTGNATAVTNASGVAIAPTFTANGTSGLYTVTATAAGVVGSANFSLTNTVGTPASIAVSSGSGQTAVIQTVFGAPLQVAVKDAGGNPIAGVTVTFTTPSSGAAATFATGNTAVTNAAGLATSSVFTANGTAGAYTIQASVSGVSAAATFSLTNTVGAAASIAATSGTPQSATIATAFASILQVVVKDVGGNPVSGATVTFTLPSSGATATFAGGSTAITNAGGIATTSVLSANTTAGSYTVTATVPGVSGSAIFSLTNTVGAPASITATAGTPQSATINTAFAAALQATVKDAGGNPLSGITVTFTLPTTGATATFASGNTAVTNANGVATTSILTANAIAGAYTVRASAPGVAAATFSLTNTVGTPASIVTIGGTPQSATINTAFPAALQVAVKDAGGNPIGGLTVTFTVPVGGASAGFSNGNTAVTNANGIATASTLTANATAGAYTATAGVPGLASTAAFSLTNAVGSAASISAVSGTPQNTLINTAFAAPLQSVVRDAGGNPVAGVTVNFALPASGATASFSNGNTAVTNANGVATSSTLTADATAGTYNVTATVSGVASAAYFSLTNKTGIPTSITVYSGSPQTAQIGTAFARVLVALVKDGGGNPVSGVSVNFLGQGDTYGDFANNGAGVAGASTYATTDANGLATTSIFTAGNLAATYNVQAFISGVSTPALFVLTNTAGPASAITATAGGNQTATILTAFPANLQATIKDASGNPVRGVTVTFTSASVNQGTFPSGVLTAAASTNTNGIATAPVFTAGISSGGYNVTATAANVTGSASFYLTNTAGAPATISTYQGANQSAIIGTAFASRLVALVRDGHNNGVSGVTVTFAAPSSGASETFAGNVTTAITDASGLATSPIVTANSTAGAYSVTASATGVTGSTAFSLTNTPGTPYSIAAYSVASESAPVGTAFPGNLQAIVRDSGNNAVSGVTVTFAVPTTGASGSFAGGVVTATTNTNGIATASTFTANTTPGAYQVTASVAGVASPAAFTLTNTQGIITAVSPSQGVLAQTLNVVVTGSASHFAQGTTTAYFGAGITVNTVTVTSQTAATVNITISPTTSLGYRSIALTTGTEVATDSNAFYIGQGTAALTSLNPASGAQAAQANVVVTGSNTNFQQGTTTASFGNDIGVNSVTVTDLTHATVNISIGANATLGTQTVTLTTGGEVASLANGFTITSGQAKITIVNPATGHQGDTADSIILTGQSTHFVQGTTTAGFGAGITVTSLSVNSPSSATALISIDPTAAIGNRTVTLTTGSETASSPTNGFVVTAGVPSATANPNFGIQGANPTVVITGSFTSFVQGVTTVSFSGGGITTGTVTVNGPTQLSVPIQIGTGAGVGARTITVDTNGNQVTATFNVVAGMPVITLINPNVGVPNSTVSVHIAGNFTHWVSGTTMVSFGAGIAVGGAAAGQPGPVTVNNSGDLTASIAIATAAALGPRTVIVTTGSEVESVGSGFTVQTCSTTAPTLLISSPEYNASNVPLNAIIQLEFSAPIDRTTVNANDFRVYDNTTAQAIPGAIAIDASGRILTFTPSILLPVGRQLYAQVYSYNGTDKVKDTCGNVIYNDYFYFTTTFSTETTGPSLIANSPLPGDTAPENVNVVLQFSEPINPITQPAGIVVSTGGVAVAGTYTPSPDYTTFTFVPGAALAANTTYTVTTTAALQDGAGNPLTNPGSFTFTTGSATDTSPGSVLNTDPYSYEMNVQTGIHPTVYFSKIVDPITLNPASFYLTDADTGRRIPVTAAVSTDRLSATLTPLSTLQPSTEYSFSLGSFLDLAGNTLYGTNAYFYTGSGPSTTPATIATLSPANGVTGAPINTRVIAVASAPLDSGTVNNATITLKTGNTLVPGTTTINTSTYKTLTFVPTANLTPSTTYTATVSGLLDGNGLAVPTATTTFTTSATTTNQTSFTLVSSTPASGDTNVANNAPITLTFSAPVDPTTIANILVRDYSNSSSEISGTFAVSSSNAAQVVFTPTTPYPANAQINVYTYNYLYDLAGNTVYANITFTAAGTADTTPFKVLSVSPANGTTGVGRNPNIVLTFNKSIDRSTLTANSNALQLFAGDTNIYTYNVTYSADGRSISFQSYYYNTLPPNSTINIDATPLIKDLSGNPLVNFTSQFTTAADIPTTAPAVVQMIPASGASDVLQNTPITLYLNGAPLNPATVTAANFHVSQNGVLTQGTITVSTGGQSILFTPASPFAFGALVQVFLEPAVTDIFGNPLTYAYSGQFTVQGNPSTVAPVMTGSSPAANATNVPLNVLPQMKFDQPLLASSVDNTSVFLFETCNGAQIPGTAATIGDGSILQFTPAANLPTTCNGNPAGFYLQINNQTKKVTNLDGIPVSGSPYFYFYPGTAPDHTAPTVVSIAPPASAQNVGINAVVYLQFSKLVDPLSVTAATVQIAPSGQPAVPVSVSFDSTGTFATIQPQVPLPANTQLTVSVSGVTDTAGNAVTPYTSAFTTGTQAVTAAPVILDESIPYGSTNVPTNAVITVQFDQPMAAISFTPANFYLYDTVTGLTVPAKVTLSADGTTATLTPTSLLSVNRQYYYYIRSVRGITGNAFGGQAFYFTTQSQQSALLPLVAVVNPANNLTAVPTNAIVQLQFNEPIAPDSLSHVAIDLNGTPIPTTAKFDTTNTILTLTPAALLQPNTTYTITATGVVDDAGHAQTTAFSSTFTTAASADIVGTSVVPTTIPNYSDTNVALNVHPTVFFTKRLNPISLPVGGFYVRDTATGAIIPSAFTVSADQLSATLTPLHNLQPFTQYNFYFPATADITGNSISAVSVYFTTGAAATTTGASVTSISPPNGQSAVPLNATVIAVFSLPVTQSTFPASPIVVTAGSTTVPGTTTLNGDQVTLTFTPTAPFAANTTYTVSVGGFQDQNGNTVQTATSTFTTGAATETGNAFTVLSVTPGNGTTISSNTTPIVITFNHAFDPLTALNILIRDQSRNYDTIAGTWSVNGAVATFTPLSPYPANDLIDVNTYNSVFDFAGYTTYSNTTFTAANTADTTAPTVTSVTPANGATTVGDNPPIILTFSKSMNPATLNPATVSVFAGDKLISNSITSSGDGRTFSIRINGTLPPTTLITVSVSSGAQDLSGNALAPFQSQFTTAAAPTTGSQAPTVVSQVPGSGATDVSQNTVVTLYTNGTPIDSSTLNANSFQLSANGQLVSGSITLVGDGHAIQFTPSGPLPYGALVQVFLNTHVMDTGGYPLQYAYTGQFTIQGDPASVAPVMTGANPVASSSNIAPNVLPQMRFDQKLSASTLTASTVYLVCGSNGQHVAGTPSLIGNGTIVQFTPSADLPTTCSYFYLYVVGGANGVTNTDGIPIAYTNSFYFYVSGSDDTTHPTVTAIGPPSGSKNVGINAKIFVQFSKPIDPLTATATTLAVTSGNQTVVPASISFDSTNSTVTIVPSTPLPPNATITVTVSGVTDPEGNTVTTKTSTFTTATGPDTTTATVTATSIAYNDTISLNTTAFSITFNKPIDPLSVYANSASFRLYSYQTGQYTTGTTVAASSDIMTFLLTIPANQLVAGNQYALQLYGATDLAGNPAQNSSTYFTVAATSDTVAPTVLEVNPFANLTNVPTNVLPQIEFSKEISAVSAQNGNIQLLQGTTVVPATVTLSRGDTVATITPNNPLAEGTAYTISASGVQDIQGTPLAAAYTSTFTTSSSGISLTQPTLVSVTPANGTINVPTSAKPVLVFNEAVNPISFDPSQGYFLFRNNANSVVVPATLSFSADGKTLTITPTSALTSGTTYQIYFLYYELTDVAGNTFNYPSFGSTTTFTVQ